MHHGIKTLLLLFTIFLYTGCSKLPLSSSKKGKLQTIAFYNTENFYDSTNDPANTGDDAYTPDGKRQWTQEKYRQKVQHIGTVIRGIGDDDGPELIGLSEVENRKPYRLPTKTPALLCWETLTPNRIQT